jgi:hypothetical protein
MKSNSDFLGRQKAGVLCIQRRDCHQCLPVQLYGDVDMGQKKQGM